MLIPLGITLGRGVLWSFFPGPAGALMLLASFAVLVGWWVVATIQMLVALANRAWARAGMRVLVLTLSVPLIHAGMWAGDFVHLGLLYPYYRQQIALTSDRPVTFDWGDQAVLVLDGLMSRSLVYDETGVTDALVGIEQPRPEGLLTFTERLIGPFYIQTVTNR